VVDIEWVFLFVIGYSFYICSLAKDMGVSCEDGKVPLYTGYSQNNSLIMSDLMSKRYRFCPLTNQCIQFGYFGCGGNLNNFLTDDLCNIRCSTNDDLLLFVDHTRFTSS
jgi:hypothetical protein